jgi:SAM-dependent methyltransferase
LTGGGSSIAEVQALLRVLAAGRDVAELGAAFGEGAAALAETARSVVTVELDPARVAAARERLAGLENVELLEGDTLKQAAACFSDIPASIASTNSRRPASPSFALACRFITALLWVQVLADPHTLKGGPDVSPSAVHNLCGQLS